MSREAFESYERAVGLQHKRNEARHIRTRVHEAREAPNVAGLRWPFELLQNALDAGPRSGRNAVTVALRHEPSGVVFQHDGAPFSVAELAALLSGGSSKEFGSDKTTGRFGTGFLVTHVLAEHAALEGLVSVDGLFERFQLSLDRSGDEDAILDNIESCNDAIVQAEQVSSIDNLTSARFEYPLENDLPLSMGVAAFRSALPYLFGTRRGLGEVEIGDASGTAETWTPEDPIREDIEGGHLEDRQIKVRRHGDERCYRIVRFELSDDAHSGALVLLELIGRNWSVMVPGSSEPRIYAHYPLRGSSFVPISFVLDGRFEPDQERNRALMNDWDKRTVSEALDAAVLGVKYACAQGWENSHLLARAGRPASGFDPDDGTETDWWESRLLGLAREVAALPIVTTRLGQLPAITSEGRYADFVLPRLVEASTTDETTIDRMWPLMEESTELFPPVFALAHDWSQTAAGWNELGLKANLVTAEALATYVRGDASTIADLRVSGDACDWLARFIDVVGECWKRRDGIERTVLAGLLPNQRGDLCSASDLRRDVGVSEELKDVADAVGLYLRRVLLSGRLVQLSVQPELTYADDALATAIPEVAAEEDVVGELLEHLRGLLPEGQPCLDTHESAIEASLEFLAHLWRTLGAEAAPTARLVPLINSNRNVDYWSSDRMMMAPIDAWGETARAFADAYPPDRVLDAIYARSDEVVTALAAWGIAHADPIITSTPRELDKRRLAAMVAGEFDSEGVVVRGEDFSQIALLPRELLNRVQEIEQARSLLGLVLCHVAPNDSAWREYRTVKGSRARETVEVPVRGALWIGDLRSRAWVPVRGEDDKPAKAVADPSTLRLYSIRHG